MVINTVDPTHKLSRYVNVFMTTATDLDARRLEKIAGIPVIFSSLVAQEMRA